MPVVGVLCETLHCMPVRAGPRTHGYWRLVSLLPSYDTTFVEVPRWYEGPDPEGHALWVERALRDLYRRRFDQWLDEASREYLLMQTLFLPRCEEKS